MPVIKELCRLYNNRRLNMYIRPEATIEEIVNQLKNHCASNHTIITSIDVFMDANTPTGNLVVFEIKNGEEDVLDDCMILHYNEIMYLIDQINPHKVKFFPPNWSDASNGGQFYFGGINIKVAR